MAIINITPEMLEAGKPWKAEWTKVTILEIIAEPSKDKASVNFLPIVEYGWASDNSRIDGKRLSKWAYTMNNKNPNAFGQNMIPLATAVLDRRPNEGEGFDTDRVKNVELWAEIFDDVYNGQVSSKIKGWASKSTNPTF
jgi:hypothetical protein